MQVLGTEPTFYLRATSSLNNSLALHSEFEASLGYMKPYQKRKKIVDSGIVVHSCDPSTLEVEIGG